MNNRMLIGSLLAVLLAPLAAGAQVAQRPVLTLDGAKTVLAAAEAEARRQNFPASIAVVDEAGNLLAMERYGDWTVASANVAIGKARTAAHFRRATGAFEEIIRNGRTAMVTIPDFTPLQGGVPIVHDGKVVGAIGISGSNPQKDEDIANVGVSALSSAPLATNGTNGHSATKAVTFFSAREVEAAFAKGAVLLDGTGRDYMVHASRRTEPGQAEVHTRDTDIIYVLGGEAVFVTGGTVVDAKPTAEDEIRGAAIENGTARKLVKGDVIVVPEGTPHWFKEVKAPFTYYVVKAR